MEYRLISDFVKNAAGLVFKWLCQNFTTAIRRAAAGFWGVPGQLEPQAATWWHRAAGLIAYWKAWKTKKNKDGLAQDKRSSQRDDGHHSPHDCLKQQSSVLFINTSPSAVHTMGSGIGQMMGSHSTLIVSLSQTQFLQPLFQVSPTCSRDEDWELEQHGNTGNVQ